MNRILPIVALYISLSFTAVAQETIMDEHARFATLFVMSIDSATTLDDLLKHFDDSLNSDTLRIQLDLFKSEILKCKSRAKYYTMKAPGSGSKLVYNVNIHDPKTKTIFGNLRLVFKNNSDFLILDWKYFREEDRPGKENEEFIPSGRIPPPPPPKE